MAVLVEEDEAHGPIQTLARNFSIMVLVVPDKVEALALYVAHIVAKPLREARGRSQIGKKNFGRRIDGEFRYEARFRLSIR